MDLKNRLDTLLESGVISKKNYVITTDIILFLQNEKKLTIKEENAAAFVTHLCMALERIDKGNIVSPLDPTVLEAVRQESQYLPAYSICKEIQQKYPCIDDTELDYLCMHLGTLLSMQ
jgi:transcriptional regulatory protein LevR